MGRPFLEEHLPDLVLPPAYYVDGQVREEAFEWGAFLQSKMHRRGVTCGDCHDAHSGRLRASASATCAQCHDPGTFAQREHHGHAPEGPGAECVECHMPPTVFMGVHRRHDHSFRVPRPDLSVEYGVPNACTTCHDDRSASWALASLSAPVRARISGRSTSAGAFAGATAGDVAAATLVEFARQKAESSPLLAASAWTLRARLGLQMAASDLAEELGRSESPLIQLGLLTTLELFPVHERAALAPRAPGGPRAVRLAWLSALAPARAALSPAGQADLRLLIGELRAHTARRAEDPAAQVLLGEVLLDAGDPRGAREPLRAALTLEPGYPPAAALLALAEEGLQNVDAAREVLERARARHPREPGLVLALAELEVRAGRRERALHLLAEGVQSHPDHADLTYLYLVAMAESQMSPATLRAVRTARSRFPQHDGIRILDTELSARPRTTGGAW